MVKAESLERERWEARQNRHPNLWAVRLKTGNNQIMDGHRTLTHNMQLQCKKPITTSSISPDQAV